MASIYRVSRRNGSASPWLPLGATAVTIAVAAFVTYIAGEVMLLAFGGTLLAVFLNALGLWLSRVSRLTYRPAVFCVILVLVVLVLAAGTLCGARVAAQVAELTATLPTSLEQLRSNLKDYPWAEWLLTSPDSQGASSMMSALPGRITGAAGNLFHFVFDVVLMAFIGFYGALEPDLYRRGLVRLFPLDRRARADQVLIALAYNLRWWMFGQVFSMLIIASLVLAGMLLLGMPLALVLGLLAGVLEMVPTIGPMVWLVPALLVALGQGTWQVLRVFVLYCVLHLFESYLLTPLVQKRAVALPPAITILAIVLMAAVGGVLGLMVAAPLTVVALVLVKMIYIEDHLGDHDIDVPGEPKKAPAAPAA